MIYAYKIILFSLKRRNILAFLIRRVDMEDIILKTIHTIINAVLLYLMRYLKYSTSKRHSLELYFPKAKRKGKWVVGVSLT